MTAREDLERALGGKLYPLSETNNTPIASQELINAFAHELAELIRMHHPDTATDYDTGAQAGADLIDPGKQSHQKLTGAGLKTTEEMLDQLRTESGD